MASYYLGKILKASAELLQCHLYLQREVGTVGAKIRTGGWLDRESEDIVRAEIDLMRACRDHAREIAGGMAEAGLPDIWAPGGRFRPLGSRFERQVDLEWSDDNSSYMM